MLQPAQQQQQQQRSSAHFPGDFQPPPLYQNVCFEISSDVQEPPSYEEAVAIRGEQRAHPQEQMHQQQPPPPKYEDISLRGTGEEERN